MTRGRYIKPAVVFERVRTRRKALRRALVRGGAVLALLLALLALPLIRGPQTAVYAAPAEKPTHVVLKLEPWVDIDSLLAEASTFEGLKGTLSLQQSFRLTTIHILTGEGWDPSKAAKTLARPSV